MDTSKFLILVHEATYNYISSHDRIKMEGRILQSESYPSKSDVTKISYFSTNDHSRPRKHLSVRRYLNRILKLNDVLSDQQLDEIADKILAQINCSGYTIEVLKGQAIVDAYANRVGGNSCMTGDNSHKVQLYADNPSRVRLAVVRYQNSSARCLIWFADDKKFYFDRIYSDRDRCYDILQKELSDKGIIDAYEAGLDIKISGLIYVNGHIPYMDTMKYGELENDLLTVGTISGSHLLENTDGYYTWISRENGTVFRCECCDNEYDIENEYYTGSESICEFCYDEYYFMCGECGEPSRIDSYDNHSIDGIRYCGDCIPIVAKQCCHCNDWYAPSDVHTIQDQYVCHACFNTYVQCYVCNTYNHLDNFPEIGICKDCTETHIRCSKCCEVTNKDEINYGKCRECNEKTYDPIIGPEYVESVMNDRERNYRIPVHVFDEFSSARGTYENF